MKRPNLRLRPLLAGLALLAQACTMHVPSPLSGLNRDPTPRLLDPGRMNTQVAGYSRFYLDEREEGGLHLAHSLALRNGLVIGGVMEGSVLTFPSEGLEDTLPDEVDGLYLGITFKQGGGLRDDWLSSSFQYGLGWGSLGKLVDYVDGSAAWSIGVGGPYVMGFASFGIGTSVPYRRTHFESMDDYLFDIDTGYVSLYRHVPSIWYGSEYGGETAFGNADRGVRLYFAQGFKYFRLLQEDRVRRGRPGEDDPDTFGGGYEFTTRFGLSWTY